MTLKELQKLIKEEYTSFLKEQDEMPPMPGGPAGAPAGGPKSPTVNVSDKDVDLDGDDAEATLKKMFDMLKDFFEGDDKGGAPKGGGKKADKGGDDKKKDDKGGDDKKKEKEDMKESRRRRGKRVMGRGTKGKRVMAESKLQSRFKKLANITK